MSSRVVLPIGIERPKDVKPDPLPPKPLTPPVSKIDRSPGLDHAVNATVAASVGSGDTFGVEGACRYGETEVLCWGPDGKVDEKLSGSIRAALLTRGSQDPLPVTLGRKTRLIVTLVPPPKGAEGSGTDVQPASRQPRALAGLALPGLTGGRTRNLVVVEEGASAKSSAVMFTSRTRLPNEVPIALRSGATAKLGGCALTVKSVERLKAQDEDRFFVRNRPAWRVVISSEGRASQGLSFFPVDPYPLVWADGRRGAFDDHAKGGIRYAPNGEANIQSIYYSELPKGSFAVLLDRDPAKVKSLRIGGNEERRTIMSGIPLDPF